MSDTVEKTQTATEGPHHAVNRGEVATFSRPRIPFHPAVQERFGVDQAGWRALIDAIWPAAKTADAVVLALSYCKARNLDPFKRPVHIVPVYSKEAGRMVESCWPGIGELRITAFRTGLYAGRDKPEYGPDVKENLDGVEMTYPEWCEITVHRLSKNGERMPYPGPRVYWIETYATAKRDTRAPNEMWRKRPHGQIEKCAEAAALRAAFPEEIGNDYTAEEMEGQIIDPHGNVERAATPLIDKKQSNLERFEDRHAPVTDVAEQPYEIYDVTGVAGKPQTDVDAAVGAYRAFLLEGERQQGEAGLTTVWDNNQGLMQELDERGHPDISKELSREYGESRKTAAARAQANAEREAKAAVDTKDSTEIPRGTETEVRGPSAADHPERASVAGAAQGAPSASPTPAATGGAGTTDLLGGTPAEDLFVPFSTQPPATDLDFYARQLLAMIAEQPNNTRRRGEIKTRNERGLLALKAGAVARYDEIMTALHRKP